MSQSPRKKMSICITGASGLLGRALSQTLSDYSLTQLSFSNTTPPYIPLDLTQSSSINQFFTSHSFNVIIHAAAEKSPDKAAQDPDRLKRVCIVFTFEDIHLNGLSNNHRDS
jgi:dTDP-4-dehydrorhamnose reductase